ncbi:MAG: hypothetical protein P1V51_23505, partial [Deltaproteobacteria bacterium]|nr:hypothetical protein [Deltaproteobacteria bacterium]
QPGVPQHHADGPRPRLGAREIVAAPPPPAPPEPQGAPGTVGATVPLNVPADPSAPVTATAPELPASTSGMAPPATAAPLPAPPAAPPSSAAGNVPREVSFHDSALDELSRLDADERRRLRAAARGLSGNPYPLETVVLRAPYEGRHGLPVGGTGRVLVYQVTAQHVVIEAILPGAAFGIADPGSAGAPTPPPAAPPGPPASEPAGDFVPPP